MQVLTISQDSQGKEVVSPFFKQRKFAALQPYIDAENQFGFHYASGMLPTTVLYDSEGKEVVRVIGAMDWRGKKVEELIARLRSLRTAADGFSTEAQGGGEEW